MTRSVAEAGAALGDAIREAGARGEPALAAFLTAGCPSRAEFPTVLGQIATEADIVEIGVPFSDPMADGVTIQESSRRALADGVDLPWILETLRAIELPAPIVLMSYLNPLLSYGFDRLAVDAAGGRVSGLIIPDLPLEESGDARTMLSAQGVALIQLVTPLTPPRRQQRIASASQGFLYAVTRAGITGAGDIDIGRAAEYLEGLRRCSPVPVMAGFGIRTADDVRALAAYTDGVIVGSALVEHVSRGGSGARFLRSLRLHGEVK